MPQTHYVKPGEYLAQIARSYGFVDFHTIWDAPENQDLKNQRKNPNVLFPGDKLVIPDKELGEESRSTERRHRFEFQGQKLMLRIQLLDLKNKPVAGHEGTLTIEGDSKEFKTGSDGMVEKEISVEHAGGKLVDAGKPNSKRPFQLPLEIPIKIGHLDPEDKVTGQIARLNNLGYNAGEVPDHRPSDAEAEKLRKSPQFLSAVEEFQCDHQLKVDGICGDHTREKLVKVHGC